MKNKIIFKEYWMIRKYLIVIVGSGFDVYFNWKLLLYVK